MENSMEVPWKTKHRGIIWSCNPFPGLDLEKFIWNDTCTPIFKVAPFTTAKTQNPPKCPVTEKWRLRGISINWNTTQSKNRKNNDIGNSIDVPRNYHPNGVNQGEKDRYPAGAHTGGPINSSQWAGAQNRDRLTDRESRAVIIKGSQKGGIN